jgi:hypothetical protein
LSCQAVCKNESIFLEPTKDATRVKINDDKYNRIIKIRFKRKKEACWVGFKEAEET